MRPSSFGTICALQFIKYHSFNGPWQITPIACQNRMPFFIDMKNCASHLLKAKDEISSQISAQLFDLCDHELFPETLQNSDEVTSCSNCCYEENSSYPQNLSLPLDIDNFTSYQNSNDNAGTGAAAVAARAAATAATSAATNASAAGNHSRIPVLFDSQEEMDNDISASIDFSPSPPFSVPPLILGPAQQDQFGFSSGMQAQPQAQISLVDSVVEGFSPYPASDSVVPLLSGGSLPSVFDEDCLSSVPPYLPLNPSSFPCSFLGPAMGSYLPAAPAYAASAAAAAALSADGSGNFSSSLLMASELQPQDLDFQGDSAGIYCPDSIQSVFNSGELQALGNESQQLMGGAGNSTSLAADIPNMGDQTFKVGKLSVEQRKEKIHRYMKKRNERNFSKKIKYACRKTLADSRPRVRGRFAKNDDFGETPRAASSNHEEDDEEEVVVKEEDDMVDSSDIFAHISGVNSFKCNYPIQSWI